MIGVEVDILIERSRQKEYLKAYEWIQKKVEQGELKPVKSSGSNGKIPWLYQRYKIIENKKENPGWKKELMLHIAPPLQPGFYLKHPSLYEKDRAYVLRLSEWISLDASRQLLKTPVSLNERSFQIFNDEKYLQNEGKRLLKNLSISLQDLNVYETVEPLIYYSSQTFHPQNILIIENLDTYISCQRFLSLHNQPELLMEEIHTIIYGAGRRIERSFLDLDLFAPEYLKDKHNTFFYWGDLDWEGIRIFQEFTLRYSQRWNILPFQSGYLSMLRKSRHLPALPLMKKMQRMEDCSDFMHYFDESFKHEVMNFLNQNQYLPQEIITLNDLERGTDHE